MNIVKIYYLEHPEKNTPLYVGATTGKLSLRLKAHNEKIYKKGPHSKEALDLRRKGLRFRICEIDQVPVGERGFWKQYWVEQLQAWGFRLANSPRGHK